ncbi:MAG: enoyl-CoA hydratase/isomerase family protein [Gammaproteobacteria bacterium]|nr:enoyl-CoA hydratase/isomerase family protein [Gammaproteobacteria bacterium]
MSEPHILFDVSDQIATITLNRPEARNALSNDMREHFDRIFEELRDRAGDDVKVVIITGAGGAFCAGGDVKAMGERDKSPIKGRTRLREAHQRIYDLLNIELPTIALVDGAAAGAGCNLALAADFVLATPRAMFMEAFGRIGLVPDWGGFFILPRLVGLAKAKEMVFTARKIRAPEALEMGLVYQMVGQDTAMEEAREFAGRFKHASTTAIGIAKNILNNSFNSDLKTLLEFEAMGQGMAGTSDYHEEAVRRFREKEPAMFDWEALEAGSAEGAKKAGK